MNILILTTDAGGGHRSVARALAAGFDEVSRGNCAVQVVDVSEYAPFPLSHVREFYVFMMRYPALYAAFFEATNSKSRQQALDAPAVGLAMEAGVKRLLREYQPDIIVATHPMGAPALTAILYRRRQLLPYYTVVTDYGTLHTWWAYPFGEAWFAPCQDTADHLVCAGLPSERVIVSGFPVHPRFARRARPAAEIRQSLGLEPERFTILVVGGAEGVGPLEAIVEDLAATPAPWQLNVVAGRNTELKERLEARAPGWAVPVRIEGLVQDMPDRMHAANLLLTKAGAATLSEGLTCGLPMVLIDALPGQEAENAEHFQRMGVARQLASPAEARATLLALATPGSPALRQMQASIQVVARPTASLDVARYVLDRGKTVTAPPLSPLFALRSQGRLVRRRLNVPSRN